MLENFVLSNFYNIFEFSSGKSGCQDYKYNFENKIFKKILQIKYCPKFNNKYFFYRIKFGSFSSYQLLLKIFLWQMNLQISSITLFLFLLINSTFRPLVIYLFVRNWRLSHRDPAQWLPTETSVRSKGFALSWHSSRSLRVCLVQHELLWIPCVSSSLLRLGSN